MSIIIRDKQKINIFTNIFKHLKVFGETFNLMFNSDKLYIQGMDSARVSLFELVLVKSWFDEYNITKPITIGVNIELMFKILHSKNDDHIIYLFLKEGGDHFDIRLDGKIKQEFHMPLINLDTDLLGVPDDTEWDADLIIQSKLLIDIMNKHSLFGDSVAIQCTEKAITIASRDQLVGVMKTRIKFEDLIEYSVEEDGCIEVLYSLKYVLHMASFAEIANIVTVNISDSIPMRFHYSLNAEKKKEEGEELSSEENYMNFYLAPKIKEDY